MSSQATDISASDRCEKPARKALLRWLYGTLGLGFLILGAVGVFLPAVPTVGPLLAASFFFARSFPELERRLARIKLFRPYLRLIDGEIKMPLKAKLLSIALMWFSICVSCSLICSSQRLGYWLSAVVVVLGIIGTWFILNFQRARNQPTE